MILKDSQPIASISNSNPLQDDLDLRKIWRTFKSNLVWILIGSALMGAITMGYFLQQTPVYAATLLLVAANSGTQNQDINQTLIAASGLPRGVLQAALAGSIVLRKVQVGVEKISELNQSEKQKLRNEFERAIRNQGSTLLKISSDLDFASNGIYTIKAEYTNPKVAAILANLAGEALLDWDVQRALRTINSSIAALQNQITDVDSQIKRSGLLSSNPTIEQRSLLDLRASRFAQLNSIRLYSRAVIGTLTVLSPAEPPLSPIRPVPYRNGLIAAVLGLFLLTGIALLRVQWIRAKVENGNDIKRLGLYEIATIPKVQSKNHDRTSALLNLMDGAAGQSLQFIRAYLLLLLGKEIPKTILVTSSLPGEGKSLMSAALANSMANAGNRVLLIDADLSKPEQFRTWGLDSEDLHQNPLHTNETLKQITICTGKTILSPVNLRENGIAQALINPEQAKALAISDNLHIIPAFKNHEEFHTVLNIVQLKAAIQLWSSHYDVVVIDSPPVLAVADSVMISSIVNGVVIVAESNRTPLDVLERTKEILDVNRARIFGVVLNKVRLEDGDQIISYGYGKGYGYGYGQESVSKKKVSINSAKKQM